MRVAKAAGFVAANQRLGVARDRLKKPGLDLTADDDEIMEWCDSKAWQARLKCERRGDEEGYAWACRELALYGIPEPESHQGELFGKVARVQDRSWWLRQVRKLQVRTLDQVARDFRLVRKGVQCYASDEAVRIVQASRRRNRSLLERLEAENQNGDVFTLAELADKSPSRPDIRRGEMMARISGFEQIAKHYGHAAIFVTLTAPSRFHVFAGKGGENGKYRGQTVRDAQGWIMDTWSRIRSALHRRKIHVYGLRVAEPHHDGCPHAHFLLFCEPSQVRGKNGIAWVFRHWALADSPLESGARHHRCKVVQIDPSKGSAAGYIAKYVAKSIDGAHIGTDLEGNVAMEAAGRICAWASAYGVRQFQQIGGPSVTVWRELRRLREEMEQPMESYRSVCDAGDWAAFVMLMGGPLMKRDAMPVRVAYQASLDVATGEVTLNKYSEPAASRVVGVIHRGKEICTRFFRWIVRWAGSGGALPPGRSPGGLDLCQ